MRDAVELVVCCLWCLGASASQTFGDELEFYKDSRSLFNKRLEAWNVVEVDINTSVLDEAAEIFGHFSSRVRDVVQAHDQHTSERRWKILQKGSQAFFVFGHHNWDSNMVWVSVDNRVTYDIFLDIFNRLGLRSFSKYVDYEQAMQVYSAFFVVRTRCESTNLHADWSDDVGTNAFTIMIPLRDQDTPNFQLLYEDASGQERQYRYQRGKGIALAGGFMHSTEPGSNEDLHVYLCFTFGSDKASQWELIEPTADAYQSRMFMNAEGKFKLTKLGKHKALKADVEEL